jgi:hypothetical protein
MNALKKCHEQLWLKKKQKKHTEVACQDCHDDYTINVVSLATLDD